MAWKPPPRKWNGKVALDPFCCQGGNAMGWYLAGFDVVGVDKDPQPRYPFEFHRADAVEFIRAEGYHFDVIAGSPPCQLDTECQRIQGRDHPDLIGPAREAMESTGKPYIIENVGGALAKLRDPVELCGAMFGLQTYRHRYFETGGWKLKAPDHPEHLAPQAKMGRPIPPGHFGHYVGNFSGVEHARRDLDVPWMNRNGIRECIPPAYARYIGGQFLAHLNKESHA